MSAHEMNDGTKNRITWQVGPAFFGIVLQLVAGAFAAGAIYYRLDANITKVDLLAAKVEASQNVTVDKFARVDMFTNELKISYDYIRERLARMENKLDTDRQKN
jgi:hypothetical protein